MEQQRQAGPLGPDVAVTHILVVADPVRSRDFWVNVLGAELYREYGGTSVVLRFAGTWLLILATWFVADLIYHQSNPPRWYYGFKDAGFYLGIAEHGYAWTLHAPHHSVPQSGWSAFFPLFPLLGWLINPLLPGGAFAALVVVSNIAFLAAVVLLHRLFEYESDARTGLRSTWYLVIFPAAGSGT